MMRWHPQANVKVGDKSRKDTDYLTQSRKDRQERKKYTKSFAHLRLCVRNSKLCLLIRSYGVMRKNNLALVAPTI